MHHVRKSPLSGQPGRALRGSGDLHAWSDSSLFLLHRPSGVELHAEHRSHPAPAPIGIEPRADPAHLAIRPLQTASEDSDPLQQRVLVTLSEAPSTRAELRERLRVRNETLGRVLAELETAGRVRRIEGQLAVSDSRP